MVGAPQLTGNQARLPAPPLPFAVLGLPMGPWKPRALKTAGASLGGSYGAVRRDSESVFLGDVYPERTPVAWKSTSGEGEVKYATYSVSERLW